MTQDELKTMKKVSFYADIEEATRRFIGVHKERCGFSTLGAALDDIITDKRQVDALRKELEEGD